MLTLEGAHFLVSLYQKIREEEHGKLGYEKCPVLAHCAYSGTELAHGITSKLNA